MTTLVVVAVKTSSHTVLNVGQIGKDGPVTLFKFFGFQARPQAFSLRGIQALTAATLRAQAPLLVEQRPVSAAAIPPTPVGMHEQARGQAAGPAGYDVTF